MTGKNNVKNPRDRLTQIILDDEIQTPYPFCPLPRSMNKRNAVTLEKLRFKEDSHQLRSILTVTTWEGRTVMDLRSVD